MAPALPASPRVSPRRSQRGYLQFLFCGQQTLTVSDPAKGVIANDINVYGVKVSTAPTRAL